ncbi:MAG: hypothetical protein ACE361_16100 [Aureliella sp.]
MSMKNKRVMWVLNHTTLMEWEVPTLLDMGLEVFVPKRLPEGPNSRTANVTDEYDASLSIPQADLDHLNTINFYEDPIDERTAAIINKHFGTCISAYIFPGLYYMLQAFEGNIFMRAFGHAGEIDYEKATDTVDFSSLQQSAPQLQRSRWKRWNDYLLNRVFNLAKIKNHNLIMDEMFAKRDRIFLAAAYKEIIENETEFLRSRSVYLPLALPPSIMETEGSWKGGDERVLFVCPNIDQIDYYRRIYLTFKEELGEFPYCIAGRQDLDGVETPLTTNDPGILGYIAREELDELMRTCSCMFYHSQEPRHLHYHPLEAIVIGLPLIFMSGGLLESCGGADQPGLCRSFEEARAKILRLQSGDESFRAEVCESQKQILAPFLSQYCTDVWRQSFQPIAMGRAA